MAILCGIDIGTSATKVLLCTPAGKVLGTASVEYPVYAPKPGWSEQEPEDLCPDSAKDRHALQEFDPSVLHGALQSRRDRDLPPAV